MPTPSIAYESIIIMIACSFGWLLGSKMISWVCEYGDAYFIIFLFMHERFSHSSFISIHLALSNTLYYNAINAGQIILVISNVIFHVGGTLKERDM